MDDAIACRHCGTLFRPASANNKVCSLACSRRASETRRYARDAEKRKAIERERYANDPSLRLQYSKAYYAANKDAVYLRHKAWVTAHRRYATMLISADRVRKFGVQTAPITPDALEARVAYFGGKCWMCGADADTMDHVKPLSKGGSHMLSNLRPACGTCNSSKGSTWPFELDLAA